LEDTVVFDNTNNNEINSFLEYYLKNNFHIAYGNGNVFKRENCGSLPNMIQKISELDGNYNIYFHVNNPTNGSYKTAGFAFVERLMLDCDAGNDHTNTSATDEEIKELETKISKLETELENDGIKYDFIQFTGNGFQVLISIKPIQREDFDTNIIKNYYNDLSLRTGIKFDATFDLPRVARLPYTTNIKGKRKSKIIKGSVFNNFKNDISNIIERFAITQEQNEQPAVKKDDKLSKKEEFKNFESFKKADEKLKDLYLGNYQKYMYKSRSEAESAIVIKLIYYNFSKSTIYEIMETCVIGKWQEKTDAYKNNTYDNAFNFYRSENSFLSNKGELIEIDPREEFCRILPKKKLGDVDSVKVSLNPFYTFVKNINSVNNIRSIETNLVNLDAIKNVSIRKQLSTLEIKNRDVILLILKKDDFYEYNKKEKKIVPSFLKTSDFLNYHFRFVSFMDTNEMYWYNEGIYSPHGDKIIRQFCDTVFSQCTPSFEENTVKKMITKSYIDRSIFDKKGVICLKNGVYDIEKHEFSKHNPDFYLFNKFDIIYDPTKECPLINSFIKEVMFKEDILVIEELFGYCLVTEYLFHKFFILLGDGRNGKSTMLNILKRFLGDINLSCVSLQDLAKDRFASSELYGKLANICGDIPAKAIKNTGIIKMVTGGDTITAQKKGKPHFNFVNYAKLIFSANQLPKTNDSTDAFFARYVSFIFPHKFEGKDCDPNLTKKLTTEDEISGLFNLALSSLKRLMKNESFSNSKSDEINRKEYEKRSDSVAAFGMEYLKNDPQNYIVKKIAYSKYCKFCKENKLPLISYTTFCSRIGQRYPNVDNFRPELFNKNTEKKERPSSWKGIRFRKIDEDSEDEDDFTTDKFEINEDIYCALADVKEKSDPKQPKIEEFDYDEEP